MCIYGSLLPLFLVSYDLCTYRLMQLQADGDTGCRQTRRHDRRNGQGLYLGLFCLYISSLIATELQEAVKTFYIGLFCLYNRSLITSLITKVLYESSRYAVSLLLARSLAVFHFS